MAARRSEKVEPHGRTDTDTRGEKTRRAIKKTISKLAMRRELADITLAEICKGAKLTTGAVYFHFKGKDDAIEEMVIDEIREVYADTVRALDGLDFAQLIVVFLDRSWAYHTKKKFLPRAIQIIINTRQPAYQTWLTARRPLIEVFEVAITEKRREHGLLESAAPFLAHYILNAMEDLAMDAFQWGNPTLAPFAADKDLWNQRQRELWSWAVMAPMADPPSS